MGYFSDSRRNWAGAFWAATAIPLVLDPSNPIWDESGWWEEQFGAPFAPLGPSGGNDYFTPNFWAGRGWETVGRRGPRTWPKVSPITRGTCGAQSSNLILQKNLPWTPPLTKESLIHKVAYHWSKRFVPHVYARNSSALSKSYWSHWSYMLLLLKIYPLLPSHSWQPLLLVLSDLASSQSLISEDGFTEDVEGGWEHSTILLKPLHCAIPLPIQVDSMYSKNSPTSSESVGLILW